nr:NUDIX domain-containing protein [Tessaracoccus sp. OS52]
MVVGALIVDDLARPTRVLAARRTTPPAGRWEFPGGKVEPGESAVDGLAREIAEELLVAVEVGDRLDPPDGGRWVISEALELELWWCTADGGRPTPHDSHDAVRWLTAEELTAVDWLDGDRAALPTVAARLRG